MEAILKFNLPEDYTEFEMATKGSNMHSALWEIDQWLRGRIKYAPDEMSEEAYKAFEECREKLREIIYDNGVNLDL